VLYGDDNEEAKNEKPRRETGQDYQETFSKYAKQIALLSTTTLSGWALPCTSSLSQLSTQDIVLAFPKNLEYVAFAIKVQLCGYRLHES
jgi:hypothetical protein